MRVGLCITILTAISFLIPLVSSLNFTFSSPSEAETNQEFTITLDADNSSDVYDLKAFVYDDSREYCEIYDISKSSWENPYYYLKAVFPAQKEFKLKAYRVGESKICARLRKTSSSSYTEVCKTIVIKQSKSDSPNNSPTSSQSSDDEEPEDSEETPPDRNFTQPTSVQESSSSAPSNIPEDKIVLSSKKRPSLNSEAFVTKSEKIRIAAVYGFTIICVAIIIFLAMRIL